MPLRRSPPPTTTVPKSQQTCDSDTPSEQSCVSVRQKRKREVDNERSEIRKEMTNLFSTLSNKFDKYFSELKQHNAELKESLQFMSDKYDSLLKTIGKIEEDRAMDKKLILKLEEKIEIMERKTKTTGLEIRNVPTSTHDSKNRETKDDPVKIVKSLAKAMKMDLNDADIRDVYRVTTSKEHVKPIIVELNSVIKRDKFVQSVKQFNKNKADSDKLNSEHLQIPGPRRPVFISETLTMKTQKLYYMARLFARDNKYTYCWTSRGFVYLRKVEGEPAFRIDNESDLCKLRESK